MPSVRAMISCLMFAGSSLLPTTPSIIAPTSRFVNRLIVMAVACDRPIQGGSNSCRNATISSTRRVSIRPPPD
jgi:hypothetical protein